MQKYFLTGGHAFSEQWVVCLASKFPDEGLAMSEIFFVDADDPSEWGRTSWDNGAVASWTLSDGPGGLPALSVLSDHGVVSISNREGIWAEAIRGAGLVDSDGRGYMSGIREVGGKLYACGAAGQLYHRLGPEFWQETLPELTAEEDARRAARTQKLLAGAFDAAADSNDIRAARDFFGLYEGTEGELLITGGFGLLARLIGGIYEETRVDDRSQLVFAAQRDQMLTTVGWKDSATTVFQGTFGRGLQPVARSREVANASSAAIHDGHLFIGSKHGLFILKDQEVQRFQADAGTVRSVAAVSKLCPAGDVLWIIGHNDVFRLRSGVLEQFEQQV